MVFVELGIFIPGERECVPLDSGKEIRALADRQKHEEKSIAFPIVEIAAMFIAAAQRHICFPKTDQISSDVDWMIVEE